MSRFRLGLLLWVLGCAAAGRLPPPLTDAADVLQRVSSPYETLNDLEMRAAVSIEIDGVRQNASAFILYRAPRPPAAAGLGGDPLLRLEVSGPLGVSFMSARAEGDSLFVYLPRENRFITGEAVDVLHRVTGVNVSYYGIFEAVTGLPGIAAAPGPRITGFHTRDDSYHLALTESRWIRALRIDRKSLTLREEAVCAPSGRVLSVRRLDDYRRRQGLSYPFRIAILQGEDHLRLDVRSVRFNTGAGDDRFHIRVPSDAERLDGARPPS